MKQVFVAGHNGMVGSAICRKLKAMPKVRLITADRSELDLTNQAQVNDFFSNNRIDQVYLAAARVGGIYANNTYPAEFIYQNLMIQSNVINAANHNDINKLLFLGSSCIYPKFADQPISEDSLLSGTLEETNEAYAIAKIAGIKLCEGYNRQYGRDYRCVMPTNLYGTGDNYHLENSHVIPGMIRKIHEAKVAQRSTVTLWGSGNPLREFLHVDDMAAASIFVANYVEANGNESQSVFGTHVNVGTGHEISILELAKLIAGALAYEGELLWDRSKPDGTPRKLLDSRRIKNLGWSPMIDLRSGLEAAYKDFLVSDRR